MTARENKTKALNSHRTPHRTEPISTSATFGGFTAILLWSVTVAFARSLSEQLGPITAAAAVYCVAGFAALAVIAFRRGWKTWLREIPRIYLIVCGVLFIGYMLFLYMAVGLAGNDQQVLEVGLLNYLWPTLTLVLTVVLLGKRSRLTLYPSLLLALAGIFLVLTQGQRVTWHSVSSNLSQNPAAYVMGISAAVAWSLYSVLTRKWAAGRDSGAVMIFLPVTAVISLVLCLFVDEPRQWSLKSWLETAFLGAATFLAYNLWDNSMRKGNMVLVASASYLTPFFSTIVSCLYLAVSPGPSLWIGCALLIGGSILSRYSVMETNRPARAAAGSRTKL